MSSCQKVKCLVKEMSSWSKLLRQNNFSKFKARLQSLFCRFDISKQKNKYKKKNARNEKKLLGIREVGKKKTCEKL